MKTPLRYAGGKSKAIKKITPFVEPYDTIVSPFLGGGSLEVHWASSGKKVIAADCFDILTTFWNELLENKDCLTTELQKINPTPEFYRVVKERLMRTPQVQGMLENWKTDFYKRDHVALDDSKLAAYYYFNHNCSYGPGFLGWSSAIYMRQAAWDKMVAKIQNFDCDKLSVEQSDFADMIEKHKDKFLYLDPPYYLDKDRDNKMFAGIYPMRNIPVHHSGFEHKKLRDLLLSHDGDFVLSYNDCETIRDWYSDFEFFYPSWHYSMSLGETRIGENRKNDNRDTKKASHEILIVKRAKQN